MISENACASNPCLNGGVCTSQNDEDQTYTCSCPAGCSGQNCQSCSGCSTMTCQNGGYCLTGSSGSPYCVCPNGYQGTQCENCNFELFNFQFLRSSYINLN